MTYFTLLTDGGIKLSETQIPTQEKTSFEIVYDAKAELRTWKLKTRDSRACFWQSLPRPSLMERDLLHFQLFMRLEAINYENIYFTYEYQHVFLNKNET